MKAIKHFQTITKHKILVMQECFRVGLYRQGLLRMQVLSGNKKSE